MARAPTQKRPVVEMRLECLRLALTSGWPISDVIPLAKKMSDFVATGASPAHVAPQPAAPPIRTRKRVPAKPAPRE